MNTENSNDTNNNLITLSFQIDAVDCKQLSIDNKIEDILFSKKSSITTNDTHCIKITSCKILSNIQMLKYLIMSLIEAIFSVGDDLNTILSSLSETVCQYSICANHDDTLIVSDNGHLASKENLTSVAFVNSKKVIDKKRILWILFVYIFPVIFSSVIISVLLCAFSIKLFINNNIKEAMILLCCSTVILFLIIFVLSKSKTIKQLLNIWNRKENNSNQIDLL